MNTAAWKFIVFAMAVAAAPQALASGSDLLLLHGHIYTGAPQSPWAEALSVTGSRIDAVGTDAQVSARRGPSSRVIDLHGRIDLVRCMDCERRSPRDELQDELGQLNGD